VVSSTQPWHYFKLSTRQLVGSYSPRRPQAAKLPEFHARPVHKKKPAAVEAEDFRQLRAWQNFGSSLSGSGIHTGNSILAFIPKQNCPIVYSYIFDSQITFTK